VPDGEEEVKTIRDLELENIAGNLMIAEYQVEKLRSKLIQQIRSIGYGSFGSKKTSTFCCGFIVNICVNTPTSIYWSSHAIIFHNF
jgi:hypothetical protein